MTTDPTQMEVERLLSAWRSVQAARVSGGLEARVLGRLQAAVNTQTTAKGDQERWESRRPSFWRGWSPVAATASLLCLFAGGLLVAREGSLAAHRATIAHSTQLGQTIDGQKAPAAQVPTPAKDAGPALGASRLATAGARRTPAGAIAAGHRRGRAGTSAPTRSR